MPIVVAVPISVRTLEVCERTIWVFQRVCERVVVDRQVVVYSLVVATVPEAVAYGIWMTRNGTTVVSIS